MLDWNAPAIGFYDALGAEAMDGWTTRRLTGEALARLVGETGMADPPGKAARNERRKAFATMLNAVSVALLVASLVQPLTTGHLNVRLALVATFLFVVLQLGLHYILGGVED